MRTKIAVFAVFTICASAYYVSRPAAGVPGDLRDAVAESPLDALKGEAGANAPDVVAPEPKAEKSEPARHGAKSAGSGSVFKSLFTPRGATGKGYSDKGMSDAAFDRSVSDALGGIPGTPFEKLKNLFDKGVPATQQDLSGWHAGRSVDKDDSMVGALLITRVIAEVPDGGPLFDQNKVVLFAMGHYNRVYFDEMPPAKVKEAGRFMKENPNEYMSVKFPEAIAHPSDTSTVELRKADGYIVGARRWAAGGNDMYMYFFKDVTPKK